MRLSVRFLGEENNEEPKEARQKKKMLLHKTSSIFLRNVAPSITMQEIEAVGFLLKKINMIGCFLFFKEGSGFLGLYAFSWFFACWHGRSVTGPKIFSPWLGDFPKRCKYQGNMLEFK